jgi:radical SAM superfamily enzyme YgiQ (UPF0313 family)
LQSDAPQNGKERAMKTPTLDFVPAAPGRPRVALVSLYGIENRGVRYISALLRQNGFEPCLIFLKRWVNNQIQPPTEAESERLLALLAALRPLAIGFGFGSPYLHIVAHLTARIKVRLDAYVVWGGVHATICPEDCSEHADAVCLGEGEYPMLDLCRQLSAGAAPGGIPNMWFNRKGRIERNDPRPLLEDLDALPFPDYLQPLTFFIEDNRLTARDPIADTVEYRIYPTRGCPYACTYCHNSTLRDIFHGRGRFYRIRSVESVIRELEAARKILPRIRRVKFDGDVFAFPPAWIAEFCRAYGARIAIPFEILTYPGELDENDLRLLRQAGLQKIQTGIQSGSDEEVRATYHRGTTSSDIRALIRIAHRAGVEVVFDIIFDNPLSTAADKRAIVELLLELERPFRIYLYSLTVFPKTALARDLLARGLITPDDIEGRATKSFRQFRLSLDVPRPREDVFWISLAILSSKSFIPRRWIGWLLRRVWLQAHPWPVRLAAQSADVLKALGLAAGMALRGELTLFKIRQYGSLKRVISQ